MTAQDLKTKLSEDDIRTLLTDHMGATISYEDDDIWISDTICHHGSKQKLYYYKESQTSVYKGYKQDKIEMRGDRAEMSDFPLYLNTVAGGLDCRDQTIGGFSFVVKIYAVPVVEIIG